MCLGMQPTAAVAIEMINFSPMSTCQWMFLKWQGTHNQEMCDSTGWSRSCRVLLKWRASRLSSMVSRTAISPSSAVSLPVRRLELTCLFPQCFPSCSPRRCPSPSWQRTLFGSAHWPLKNRQRARRKSAKATRGCSAKGGGGCFYSKEEGIDKGTSLEFKRTRHTLRNTLPEKWASTEGHQ